MLINYENNPDASGRGFFVLTDPPRDLGEPAGLTFSLRRTSDGLYLGSTGWTGQAACLNPEAVIFRGGQVHLEVGPGVTGQLAGDNSYQFVLRAALGWETPAALNIAGQESASPGPARPEARPAPQPAGQTQPKEEQADENAPAQSTGAAIGLAIAFVLAAVIISPYVLLILLLLLIPAEKLHLPEGNDRLIRLGFVLFCVFFAAAVVFIYNGRYFR